jgi:hypothetical protein
MAVCSQLTHEQFLIMFFLPKTTKHLTQFERRSVAGLQLLMQHH